jgi:hypothetical protein
VVHHILVVFDVNDKESYVGGVRGEREEEKGERRGERERGKEIATGPSKRE